MDFMSKQIMEVALYIIENNASIKQTAEHFGKSRETIKKYINDDDKLQKVDYNTYIVVKEIEKRLEHEEIPTKLDIPFHGRKKGR